MRLALGCALRVMDSDAVVAAAGFLSLSAIGGAVVGHRKILARQTRQYWDPHGR